MLLVVDSGNTNTVFAVYEGDACRGVWRCGSNPRRTADEYAVWLIDLMALEDLNRDDISAAIVSSVVPEGNFNLTTLCQRYFKCDPMFIGEEDCDLGIQALVDRPDQVGADRLVNTVAVHGCYDGDLIVVDFGTATTFDVVDGDIVCDNSCVMKNDSIILSFFYKLLDLFNMFWRYIWFCLYYNNTVFKCHMYNIFFFISH